MEKSNTGLLPLHEDNCFYIKKSDETILIVVVYVDDLMVATNREEEYLKFKKGLEKKFKVKDLRLLYYCVGLEFKQDPIDKSVKISQQKYIEDTLTKFGMFDCKAATTPLKSKIKLTKQMAPSTKEEADEIKIYPINHSFVH